jgi:hypothetical protein
MTDIIIQHNEEMVGANHPTKADTLNRAFLVEHDTDGTHEYQIPTGSRMWFYQNSAPTGWTLQTSLTDILLACKGGNKAYNITGGTVAGEWQQTNAGTHRHSTDGSHQHSCPIITSCPSGCNYPDSNWRSAPYGYDYVGSEVLAGYPSYKVGSAYRLRGSFTGDHRHDSTGDHNHQNTWRPHAAVGIICQKT